MANDNDTDLLEDSPDVGEDTSDLGMDTRAAQAASGTMAMGPSSSPLSEQLGMPASMAQRPPSGGNIGSLLQGGLAGLMQPLGAAAPNVGPMVQQRHGGLLTGLAGVLLDGLASGMAPSAEMAYKIPMMRQQQQMQMAQLQLQQQKMQEEMRMQPVRDKLMLAQTQMTLMQLDHAQLEMSDENQLGLNDFYYNLIKKGIDEDRIEKVTEGSLADVQKYREEHAHDPDGMQLFPWAMERDAQGNITKAALVKVDNEKMATKAFDQDIVYNDPVSGRPISHHIHVPAGGTYAQQMAVVADDMKTFYASQAGEAKTATQQGFVRDPNNPNGRAMMTRADAIRAGVEDSFVPVKSGDVEKQINATKMTNDVQTNISSYKNSMNQMYREGVTATQATALAALTPDKLGLDIGHVGGFSVGFQLPDVMQKLTDSVSFKALSNTQKQAVVDYYAALASIPVAQRAMISVGKTTNEMLNLELRTVPSPLMDSQTFNMMMSRYQRNLTQAASANVRISGMPTTEETRQRMESGQQAVPTGMPTPTEGGTTAGRGAAAGPKAGDTQVYQGFTYKFDGNQWVKQKQGAGEKIPSEIAPYLRGIQ